MIFGLIWYSHVNLYLLRTKVIFDTWVYIVIYFRLLSLRTYLLLIFMKYNLFCSNIFSWKISNNVEKQRTKDRDLFRFKIKVIKQTHMKKFFPQVYVTIKDDTKNNFQDLKWKFCAYMWFQCVKNKFLYLEFSNLHFTGNLVKPYY